MAKKNSVIPRPSSGVLLPIFSLPNHLGSGDFGPGANQFINWLKKAGQTYWMILPLGPTDSTGSPYASSSSRALNYLFISPELLRRQGLLTAKELLSLNRCANKSRRLIEAKRLTLLRLAFHRWDKNRPQEKPAWQKFCHREADWLYPAALFLALKDRQQGQPWWMWPAPWLSYRSAISHVDARLKKATDFYKFTQWVAMNQWTDVRQAAHRAGIKIIGDLPFTVRHDSVDVWQHPELFYIRHHHLTRVGGMPPDPFSPTGQRWGTPLFRWSAHRREKYAWWTERLNHQLRRVDLLRLDHFQGYVRTWNISVRSRQAIRGTWKLSPGLEILTCLKKHHPRLPLIAEDLGLPLPGAQALREKFGLPGIRLFEYAWSGLPRNIHDLDQINPDIVFMTSNHDMPPLKAWWYDHALKHERDRLAARHQSHPYPWEKWIELAYQTKARLVITTMSDLLGLGREARINRPGTKRGNWRWQLSDRSWWAKAAVLKKITRATNRTA